MNTCANVLELRHKVGKPGNSKHLQFTDIELLGEGPGFESQPPPHGWTDLLATYDTIKAQVVAMQR